MTKAESTEITGKIETLKNKTMEIQIVVEYEDPKGSGKFHKVFNMKETPLMEILNDQNVNWIEKTDAIDGVYKELKEILERDDITEAVATKDIAEVLLTFHNKAIKEDISVIQEQIKGEYIIKRINRRVSKAIEANNLMIEKFKATGKIGELEKNKTSLEYLQNSVPEHYGSFGCKNNERCKSA